LALLSLDSPPYLKTNKYRARHENVLGNAERY